MHNADGYQNLSSLLWTLPELCRGCIYHGSIWQQGMTHQQNTQNMQMHMRPLWPPTTILPSSKILICLSILHVNCYFLIANALAMLCRCHSTKQSTNMHWKIKATQRAEDGQHYAQMCSLDLT